MKHFLVAFIITCFAGPALADNTMIFKQRQESTKMTVTAVDLSPTIGSISAEGAMGEYGRVYLTYKLTPDANGKGGLVTGEGRGALENGGFASGTGAGLYYRDGTKFVMHVLFRINDGTQNLDKIVFDAAIRTLTQDVFIAK